MPLSNDLRGLAIWFDEIKDGFAEMTAEGAKAFSNELHAAVGKAEALEDQPVPAGKRAIPVGDNILVLPMRRRAPVRTSQTEPVA